jgi:hypothetical protein
MHPPAAGSDAVLIRVHHNQALVIAEETELLLAYGLLHEAATIEGIPIAEVTTLDEFIKNSLEFIVVYL